MSQSVFPKPGKSYELGYIEGTPGLTKRSDIRRRLADRGLQGKWEYKSGRYGPEVRIEGQEEFWILDGHNHNVWQCDDPQDGCMDIADEWAATGRFIAHAPDDIAWLLSRYERMEAALKWYADIRNWDCDECDDQGQRAREALKDD